MRLKNHDLESKKKRQLNKYPTWFRFRLKTQSGCCYEVVFRLPKSMALPHNDKLKSRERDREWIGTKNSAIFRCFFGLFFNCSVTSMTVTFCELSTAASSSFCSAFFQISFVPPNPVRNASLSTYSFKCKRRIKKIDFTVRNTVTQSNHSFYNKNVVEENLNWRICLYSYYGLFLTRTLPANKVFDCNKTSRGWLKRRAKREN